MLSHLAEAVCSSICHGSTKVPVALVIKLSPTRITFPYIQLIIAKKLKSFKMSCKDNCGYIVPLKQQISKS